MSSAGLYINPSEQEKIFWNGPLPSPYSPPFSGIQVMKAVDVPVLTIRLLISLKAGNKEKQTYIQLLVAAISLEVS